MIAKVFEIQEKGTIASSRPILGERSLMERNRGGRPPLAVSGPRRVRLCLALALFASTSTVLAGYR